MDAIKDKKLQMASKWNNVVKNIEDVTRRRIWKASNLKNFVKDFQDFTHIGESKLGCMVGQKIK